MWGYPTAVDVMTDVTLPLDTWSVSDLSPTADIVMVSLAASTNNGSDRGTVAPTVWEAIEPRSGVIVAAQVATLSVLWLLAIMGNLLVCCVIRRSRRLQSTTNYFVVSLAFTDILLAFLCAPFLLGDVIVGHWVFGDVMCRAVRFVQMVAPGSTMFVFVSIAVDRFYTILYPLSFKVTRTRAKQMVLTSWLVTLVVATPCFDFYRLQHVHQVAHCMAFLPNTWDGLLYVVIVFVLEFVSPVMALTYIHYRIVTHVWRTGIGGQTFQRTTNPVPRAKVKMIKMIIIVNTCNVLLMTPFFVVHLWQASLLDTVIGDVSSLYIGVTWAYFSTCVTKPLLYMCFNSNFRRGCREVFCMSAMKCYRSHAYTITSASKLSKKNYVGSLDTMTSPSCDQQQQQQQQGHAGSRTLATAQDKYSWPVAQNTPSTYL